MQSKTEIKNKGVVEEQKSTKPKAEESKRDEEIDVAKAVEVVRNFVRDTVGSLIAHQFKLEKVEKNGSQTRYVILCSVIPDVGEEREYYLIRVNVDTGKLILPLGKGKKNAEGKLELEEIDVEDKWKE